LLEPLGGCGYLFLIGIEAAPISRAERNYAAVAVA